MKQVAHRVHEHHLWSSPAERLGEFVRNKPQVESLFVGVTLHAAEPLGERLRIAVLASRADLRAAPNWIPGRVRPPDFGVLAHEFLTFYLLRY